MISFGQRHTKHDEHTQHKISAEEALEYHHTHFSLMDDKYKS